MGTGREGTGGRTGKEEGERIIVFEDCQFRTLDPPLHPRYHNVTDGQTTYDSNTSLALGASRRNDPYDTRLCYLMC